MKIVRKIAEILGIIWMVIFGLVGIIGLFYLTLVKKGFNFGSPDGIGSFLGVLFALVLLFTPGFFLHKWGTKSKKKSSLFHSKEEESVELSNKETTKSVISQRNSTRENNKNEKHLSFEKIESAEKSTFKSNPKTITDSKSDSKKILLEKPKGQVFPVNYLSQNNEEKSSKDIIPSKLNFEEKYLIMNYIPNTNWVQKNKEKIFPYVTIPKAGTSVLLPRPGKLKASGVSEADFKVKLLDFFGKSLLSQHFLVFKGAKNDYEPDFIFQDVESGLLIDIEIDEPYSGKNRKPMHYEGSADIDRDHYFNKNGWVVVRFAEEQVVKNPKECLYYLSQIIDSLISTSFSKQISYVGPLEKVKRWTYEEAEQMAKDFYREKYLGLEFDIKPNTYQEIETEIQLVKENRSPYGYIDITYRDTSISKLSDNESAITSQLEELVMKKHFCTFNYGNNSIHLVQPKKIEIIRSITKLIAYDYIQNKDQEFEIRLIDNIEEIQSPFFQTLDHNQGLNKFQEALDLAINNMLYVRFTYTNANFEDSIRTLGPLDYTQEFDGWGYHRQHIAGYCHYRKETRSFRIDRIRQLWILNMGFD